MTRTATLVIPDLNAEEIRELDQETDVSRALNILMDWNDTEEVDMEKSVATLFQVEKLLHLR